MRLYHVGFEEIKKPDIYHGRKNADFGQGFYMTADLEFAHRWAREKKGSQTIINFYDLDTSNLKIKQFARDRLWVEYIFANRSLNIGNDDADVIVGPIANDTLLDTFGIIGSGFLSDDEALGLLLIGPEYKQVVIKTEKALTNLCWDHAEVISKETIKKNQELMAKEEEEYQEIFAEEMKRISGEE